MTFHIFTIIIIPIFNVAKTTQNELFVSCFRQPQSWEIPPPFTRCVRASCYSIYWSNGVVHCSVTSQGISKRELDSHQVRTKTVKSIGQPQLVSGRASSGVRKVKDFNPHRSLRVFFFFFQYWWGPDGNWIQHISFCISTRDGFDIVDPSSMQEACHI